MRGALVAVVAGGLLMPAAWPGVIQAQVTVVDAAGADPSVDLFAGPWPQELLNAEQVERLVGPIALYPDPILALVLSASTFPVDIVKTARLVRSGGDESAIAISGVDASVKALAHHGDVLAMMDEHLGWTERLGQAYLEQPDDVMNTVQRLRTLAQGFGHLAATPQQEVVREREIIRILPVTEYVYVPVYSPTVVFCRPRPQAYSCVTFRSCSRIGPWHDLACDWQRRAVCRRDGWTWRDACDQRCRTGSWLTVTCFGRDHDDGARWWRRDQDRNGGRPHGRWSEDEREWDRANDHRDRDGSGRDGRSRPRAAEPNPPSIVGRPRPRDSEPRGEQAPAPRPPRVDRPKAPPTTSPPPPPVGKPAAKEPTKPVRPKRDAKVRADEGSKPVPPTTVPPRIDRPVGPPAGAPVARPIQEPEVKDPAKPTRPDRDGKSKPDEGKKPTPSPVRPKVDATPKPDERRVDSGPRPTAKPARPDGPRPAVAPKQTPRAPESSPPSVKRAAPPADRSQVKPEGAARKPIDSDDGGGTPSNDRKRNKGR